MNTSASSRYCGNQVDDEMMENNKRRWEWNDLRASQAIQATICQGQAQGSPQLVSRHWHASAREGGGWEL